MTHLSTHFRDLYLPTLQVLWPSLLVALALAVAGGVMGVLVALRREALTALAMPQVVTLGAAVGLATGAGTLGPAAGAVAVAMGLLAWSRRSGAQPLVLPALYAAGATVSVLVVASSGSELIAVRNLFIGIDVAVSVDTSWWTTAALLVIGATAACVWRRWLLIAQAPAVAESAGARPGAWDALFLALLATLLVLATNAVGSVMVVALLFLPPATVLPWARRVPPALVASAGVAVLACAGGFALSVETDWPFTHSVGGIGFALFLVSFVAARIRRK